jgi:hypothetical protein
MVHEAGPKPAFPKRSGTLVPPIKVLDIVLPETTHEHAGTVTATGRQQQMHVVGHQHVGVDVTGGTVRVTLQERQIHQVVGLTGKAKVAIVSTLDEMKWYGGEYQTWMSCHGRGSSLKEARPYRKGANGSAIASIERETFP